MHRPFASLALFYVRSVYGLPDFARRRRGPRGAAAVPAARAAPADPAAAPAAKRAAAKRALKSIGVGLLFLLVAADLAALFGAGYASMYAALKPAGLQSLLLLNAATSASMFLFVIGFVTAISTYYLSQAEAGLLALPIPPRVLLGGKLAMVYLADFALAFLVMAVAAVVYGANEGSPPSFYLRAFLV
ncbi:MAG: hypothetical protein JNG85_15565, partial [Spirochaetaceae bacterium]|nr:hypothetical protein [Spirochaetaceae bacterium]